MNLLTIAIVVFIVLETANILMLYFTPGTRRGNGIGVFDAYESSKKDPEVHALVSYLINWVAGTKLIFVALLIVILATGDETTKAFSVAALIVTILTYFWRLHPIIRSMDRQGEITPNGYSRTLAVMIAAFITVFAGTLAVYLVFLR